MMRHIQKWAMLGMWILLIMPVGRAGDSNELQERVQWEIKEVTEELEKLEEQIKSPKNNVHKKAVEYYKTVLTERLSALEKKTHAAARGWDAVKTFDERTMAPLNDKKNKAHLALDASSRIEQYAKASDWDKNRIQQVYKNETIQPYIADYEKARADASETLYALAEECIRNAEWDDVYKARYKADYAVLRVEYTKALFHAKCDELAWQNRAPKKGEKNAGLFEKYQKKNEEWFKAYEKLLDYKKKEIRSRYERDVYIKDMERVFQ